MYCKLQKASSNILTGEGLAHILLTGESTKLSTSPHLHIGSGGLHKKKHSEPLPRSERLPYILVISDSRSPKIKVIIFCLYV